MSLIAKTKRFISMLLALILAVAVFASPAYADTIDSLNARIDELNSTISSLNSELSSSNAEIESLNSRIAELQEKIDAAEAEIADYNTQIDALSDKSDALQLEIHSLSEERDAIYETMKGRIEYFYENQTTGIFEIMMTSDSLGDMMRRVQYMQQMYEYDSEQQQEYSETISAIKEKDAELDAEIEEKSSLLIAASDLKDSLDADVAELEGLLETEVQNRANALSEIAAAESAVASTQEELAAAEAKAAAAEAARETASNTPDESGEGDTGETEGESIEVTSSGNSYSYTQSELELIYAIVYRESDRASYESNLAVITCACNRCDSSKWGYIGSDPLSQLTAKGQFGVYGAGLYKSYLGGKVPDYCKQAVQDALNGKRNHSYLAYRCYKYTDDSVKIGGNWFFDPL